MDYQNWKDSVIELEYKSNNLKVDKSLDKPGWGIWTGPTALPSPTRKNAKVPLHKVTSAITGKKLRGSNGVLVSESRVRSLSKFKLSQVSFPFSSETEQERSMQVPIGGKLTVSVECRSITQFAVEEWNPSNVVSRLTQPAVKIRSGRIMRPIKASS